jgi:hypothetical protein
MARFARLALALVLAAVCAVSHAGLNPTWGAWSPVSPSSGGAGSCEGLASAYAPAGGYTLTDILYNFTSSGQHATCKITGDGYQCAFVPANNCNGAIVNTGDFNRTAICTSGYSFSASTGLCEPIQCAAPYTMVNGQCQTPCVAYAGKDAGYYNVFRGGTEAGGMPAGGMSFELCVPGPMLSPPITVPGWAKGCLAKQSGDRMGYFGSYDAGTGWYVGSHATHDGTECTMNESNTGFPGSPVPTTGTGTATGKVTASDCKVGEYFGEVNGVGVCVKPDPGVTPTVTDSTGSGSVTTSGPEGTVTTTTGKDSVTVCKNGQCTVTTTITVDQTTGSGTGTTTTTVVTGSSETMGLGEYCAENPKAPLCGEGGSFGGTCTSGFACEGDALECAIAKAVNEQKCLMTPSDAIQTEANKITNGTWAADLQTEVIDLGELNKSNPFGSSCPPDQTFTVLGASFIIPLASACPELQMLGNLAVAMTLLTATIFVLRGFGST